MTTTALPLPPTAPLAYERRFEEPEDDEDETTRQMSETLTGIAETVHQDEGHAYRSVHAKSHGLLRGELQVLPGLPPVLAQGMFAQPGLHAAVLRMSTTPGDLLDDAVSTPRGVALKVLGVAGERLDPDDGASTQDFLMVNGPVFAVPTAKKFLRSLKLLAATTDKAPGAKKILSAALRGLEAIIEKAGGESGLLKALGGHPATNPLGETYYTQVPVLYGPYMAKLSLAPVSPGLTALTDAAVDLANAPNALRDAVVAYFAQHGGTWELRVQLCTDIEAMPIEDASVQWPEELSPYVTVARLVMPPQPAWNDARAIAIDDGMSFSPWHGLAAHRPIGSIMRVRQWVYAQAARFRAQHNATQVREPQDVSRL